jgi:hypothetical protein
MTKTRALALSATLAALTLNVASAADEYQWEAGLGFTQNKDDASNETTVTTIAANGEYHFAPVKLGNHPWEEAAFLEHSTFVDASLGYLTTKDNTTDASGPLIAVGFTYATPEFPVRLSAGLGYSKIEDGSFEIKTTVIDLEAGYWILPELIAGLRLENTKADFGSGDQKELDISAFGKWVISMNDDLAFNAEADLGQNSYDNGSKDSNIVVGVAGDVYYRQQYGVGLSLASESGDAVSDEGLTVGVRASAWFTEQIGARVGYDMFAAKDDTVDDDSTISLEVVGRF